MSYAKVLLSVVYMHSKYCAQYTKEELEAEGDLFEICRSVYGGILSPSRFYSLDHITTYARPEYKEMVMAAIQELEMRYSP